MSDIFISYAREDLEAARRLAAALESQEWSVFWDRTIPPGKFWRDVINAALDDTHCVVVLWSRHSVTSRWVLEEADDGLNRGILVPAFIEDVVPPRDFAASRPLTFPRGRATTTIKRFSKCSALLQAFSVLLQ